MTSPIDHGILRTLRRDAFRKKFGLHVFFSVETLLVSSPGETGTDDSFSSRRMLILGWPRRPSTRRRVPLQFKLWWTAPTTWVERPHLLRSRAYARWPRLTRDKVNNAQGSCLPPIVSQHTSTSAASMRRAWGATGKRTHFFTC